MSATLKDGESRHDGRTATLGALLYADGTKERLPEEQWVALVGSMAAGSQSALRALYDRTHRIVFTLSPIIDAFVSWPTHLLHPSETLWDRISQRIADNTGQTTALPARQGEHTEPAWENVAPGILCKVLAADADTDRVSMLVRLGPGAEYPPHTHAGVEELYLLDGELWIEDRKLHPGDYNRAEIGTQDRRVWSEQGCTCLLITSLRDAIG